MILGKLGKYDEAEAMEKRVLEARARTLGEEHVDTLRAIEGLSKTLWDQEKRLDEVMAMEEKVLEVRMRILGEGHPDTLRAMTDLAYSYDFLGREQEARELMQKAIDESCKHLGENHPGTLYRVDEFKIMIGISQSPFENLV